MLSKEAAKLKDMIDKAIGDQVVTTSEYDKILFLANADMVIDAQEKRLLAEFQEMISSGMIKRVPG